MWDIDSQGQEVFFNFSTLYWATGVIFLVIGTLYGGKRVITNRSFDVDHLIESINRFKVTTSLLPPYALASLIKHENVKALPSVKMFMTAGSIVSKQICEAVKPLLPNGEIVPLYGSSEGDFIADSFYFQLYGSVGKLSPNVHVKIIDEAERNLGPNQQGEICYKTEVTFSGYFDDPEKTVETIKDNWVYSGDVGYFDDDGFLFIVDRMKDMLKYNNFQVRFNSVKAQSKSRQNLFLFRFIHLSLKRSSTKSMV